MSQQYSLRWNNHQPNFISMFGTLLTTKNLVDVTLAAEGQHLVAHKVVLSACSTYFHSLFVDNPSHHPIVILKDVKFSDLCTMVDFMYYGEVNVTQEQLPQVLETAKILKIKGLTEMPDSASLTRSQDSSADFHSGENSTETQRHSVSPCSPSSRRKRRRKSSSGSVVNLVTDDNRNDDCQNIDLMKEAITLSSVPQQRRRELEERIDHAQQAGETSSLSMDQLNMEVNAGTLPQGQWSMLEHTYPRYTNACLGGGGLQPDQGMYLNNVMNPHGDSDLNSYEEISKQFGLRLRRSKFFKRQSRVQPDDQEIKKQTSEPSPASVVPILQKHESYPQYIAAKSRKPRAEQSVGSLLIRTVTVADRQPATALTSTSTSFDAVVSESPSQTQRASHTPAVRSGPPLSCNFCWNTVDECGRILRRKTQYHCPECRTNLCIVPCFHEYHDGPEAEPTASASAR